MTEEEGGPSPLPWTRIALERAGRVLQDQHDRPRVGPGFNDYLPYVLDRLQEVCRTLQVESGPARGRSADFAGWWQALWSDPEVAAIRAARNPELKERERVTGERATYTAPDGGQLFVEDVGFTVTDDEGQAIQRGGPMWVESADPAWTFEHRFTSGNWEGQPVLDVLDAYWQRLRDDIVPTAERFARDAAASS